MHSLVSLGYSQWFLLLGTGLNFLLALVIYAKGSRRLTTYTFVVFALAIAGWTFSILMLNISPNYIWAKLAFMFPSLVPSSMVLFAVSFPDGASGFWAKKTVGLLIGLVSVVLVILTLFSEKIVVGFRVVDTGVQSIKGDLYFMFLFFIVLSSLISLYSLGKKFFLSTGVTRAQLGVVWVGIFFFALSSLATNLFLPSLGVSGFNSMGPLFSVFMIGSTTYAIVRHRLLDVRLAVRAGIYRLLLVIVFLFITTILISVATDFNLVSQNPSFPIITAALVFIVLTYPFVDKLLRNITDSFLFQREYNRQELLKQLGRSITESIDLEDLKTKIRDTLRQAMRVEKIEFQLDTQRHDHVWNEIVANHELIVYDELKRKLEGIKDSPERRRLESVGEQMSDQHVAVVMPVLASEGVIGTITLGEKVGGDAFTSTDLEALETLVFQAGVAIENAQLFTETKKFNKKLQAEISAATKDLQERNRRLTVLRQLDNIILNTLDVTEMAQKIVDLVSWEMGFGGALMVLYEEEAGNAYLRAVAMSSSPLFKRALEVLPRKLTDYRIAYGLDPSNVLYQAISQRKPIATTSFRDIYVPPLNNALADAIQKLTKSEHMVVYPLSVKGQILGATIFTLPCPYKDLSLNDTELIQSFMDESGIAIENARLYDQLEDRNKELKYKNVQLQALDRMKDELVSVASHELRTPMTSIKSYLWMALHKEKNNLNPKLTMYLDRAYQSSDRMINLVNDMLSASRLEGKRVELQLKADDVVQIVKRVVDDLRVRAKEQGLKITFHGGKNIPPALIDTERITEVIYNLVGNSIKYTPTGNIDVFIAKNEYRSLDDLSTNNAKGYVWVSVKDTGQGIAKEDLPRLFKKFSKLEQGSFVKTAETGGTGLGLYITKGFVELHGGAIWVDSDIDKGSTFTFSVPVA